VFAILALLAFLLALFGAHPGGLDMVTLGLAFIAAHLIWAWTPWRGRGTP
jgi:hypothetical protein